MSEIQFVKDENDFNNYVKHNKYLVANFTASWCGPCQMIKPVIDRIYQSEKYQKLEVVRVDLDSQQSLASKYQITSVPTFLFLHDGKVVDTVKGASLSIEGNFNKLQEMADNDAAAKPRQGNGIAKDSTTIKSPIVEEVKPLIPKGYAILNDMIFGGDFETLNGLSLSKDGNIKDVFNLSKPSSTIFSDADSQMLLYVPLTHISKIYSILIKTKTIEKLDGEANLDEDDIQETQSPNLIKVWGNKLNILSFDDAVNDGAQHEETLDIEPGTWYECKLKFVRFQNVQSLNIFFDGNDEDYHTIIDKIVIIGLGGDEKDHKNMVEKLMGEPQE